MDGQTSRSAPSIPSSVAGKKVSIIKQLSIHEQLAVESDILLHPDLYNNIFQSGDLVRLTQDQSPSGSYESKKEIILKLPTHSAMKSKAQNSHNFQVSNKI